MIRSMTGFSRVEQSFEWGNLICEIRSVNHRYLEAHYKLPDALKAAETDLRDTIKKHINRGKVDVMFHLQSQNNTQALSLNEPLAKQLVALAQKTAAYMEKPAQIDPLTLLQWPDVLQAASLDQKKLKQAANTLFTSALEKLVKHRKREGKELSQFISQRVQATRENITKTQNIFPKITQDYQTKLKAKLAELKADIDEDRYHQEVIYIAQKYDIAEELDRLSAHCNEIDLILKKKGAVGRRLDFLMQELNREANTLASKSISVDTTQISVDLKVLIEQMREQVQNIE